MLITCILLYKYNKYEWIPLIVISHYPECVILVLSYRFEIDLPYLQNDLLSYQQEILHKAYQVQ